MPVHLAAPPQRKYATQFASRTGPQAGAPDISSPAATAKFSTMAKRSCPDKRGMKSTMKPSFELVANSYDIRIVEWNFPNFDLD